MSLTPGTQVGPYRITAMLGAGGMGEVYRARDTRLQRDAALKVLPPGLLQEPERRARFEREARLLASLSHPNIAAIYGVEDIAGPDGVSPVLILEFVEGQTLADRLTGGPVPVDETVAIARQIAEALEAAHERGVIHRDLKPANVQITRDGSIKVLDFGLAKALDADAESSISPAAHSPTMTSGTAGLRGRDTGATQAGVIMGTAAYMSPEQARGRSVDRRTDIWAFGALLFELLTGTRAFPGETISDTIAAVLTARPDWTRLPAETPPALRALLARCLDPDLRQRLQSIGEARITLSRPLSDTAVGERAPRRRASRALTIGLVAITAASAAALTWSVSGRSGNTDAQATRKLDVAVDGLMVGLDRPPALSPDGARIAYVAGGRIWIRSTADFSAREVPDSDNAQYPFWSPDSAELAFVQDTKLFRMRIDGGAPQFVGEVPRDMTGSGAGVWTPDDTFLLVGSDTSGITELSGRDGQSREILRLDRSAESDFHEISQLPDRRGFLVTAHTSQAAETISVIVDGTRREVLKIAGENIRSPAYHPAGYLVFARETIRRGIWAAPFSLDSLTTTGEPFLLEASGRHPSIASDGTIMIVRPSERPSELVWIDRRGSRTSAGLLSGQVPEHVVWPTMRLSPDGQRVALGLEDDLWIYDLRRGSMSPVSRGVQRAISPTWFPAGDRLLFAGFVGTRAWSVQEASAMQTSTPARVLPETQEFQWPTSITPDGRSVIYGQSFSGGGDLWIAPLDRPAGARRLMTTPSSEREGYLSPDGRWLAYTSDETGAYEVYLRKYPIGNDREMLSSGGASSIHWSGDGRELFYRGSAGVMSVRLQEKDGRLQASVPETLFAPNDPALSRMFAAAADGQRFLFARATGSDQIGLILSWRGPDAR